MEMKNTQPTNKYIFFGGYAATKWSVRA